MPGARRHATVPQSWMQRENWEFETHTCSVAPAEGPEKCGSRRPTRSGYSCNNAAANAAFLAMLSRAPGRPDGWPARSSTTRTERLSDERIDDRQAVNALSGLKFLR